MVTKSLRKIKVVQADDPLEFERQFNEAIDTLGDMDYEVDVQPYNGVHCAYLYYKEIETYFNLVSDEFHESGIHYLCSQCPLHDPAEDGRKKYVYCKYADCGMTNLKAEACEMFYKMVKQNEIKPTY